MQSHGNELIKKNLFSTFSVCFWIKNLSDRKDFPSPLGFLQWGCCDWILKDGKANVVLYWIFCLNGETKRLSNVLDDDCWQHRCWFFTVATGNWQLATGNTWCNFSDFVSRQTIRSLDSVISSEPLLTREFMLPKNFLLKSWKFPKELLVYSNSKINSKSFCANPENGETKRIVSSAQKMSPVVN